MQRCKYAYFFGTCNLRITCVLIFALKMQFLQILQIHNLFLFQVAIIVIFTLTMNLKEFGLSVLFQCGCCSRSILLCAVHRFLGSFVHFQRRRG